MENVTASVTVNNKKHSYRLEKRKKGTIFFQCKDANIFQEFPAEDVANLLIDLPNLIIAEKEHKKMQSEVIRFRVSPSDKSKIDKRAVKKGYSSTSEYLRHLALG